MKKSNLKYIFGLTVLGLFASCSDDEDATSQRIVKSVVTADATTFNLNEGDAAMVTLTIDKPLNVRSDFKLELVGGTGAFRDYTVVDGGDGNSETDEETTVDDGYGIIGHKVILPAYASSVTFDITTLVDYLPEATETLVFRLYPMGNSTALVDENSETITITLANTTLDEIQSELKWATKFNAHGNFDDITYLSVNEETKTLEAWDFDLFVFGPNNIFTGASSDEPEYATIASSRPDGDYELWVDLWDTPRRVAGGPALGTGYKPVKLINLKPILTVSKPGVWVQEIDLSGIWDSNVIGSNAGPAADMYVARVNKAGTVYTLYNDLDEELATGRSGRKVMPKVSRNK